MSIGDNIKHFREIRNMTQIELARKVGYKTRTSLSKIENNENTPTQKNLLRIAAALDVSPADLLNGASKPISPKRAELIQLAWAIPEPYADLMIQLMQTVLQNGPKDIRPVPPSGKE